MAKSRRAHVAVGAMLIVIPGSAIALTATRAVAQPSANPGSAAGQPGNVVQVPTRLKARQLVYGRDVIVTGTAPASDSGEKLALEFSPAGSRSWRELTSTTVGAGGRFRLAALLKHSGLVKVTGVSAASDTRAAASGGDLLTPTSDVLESASERVTVAAELHVPARNVAVLSGQSIDLRGKLLPALAGRRVRLQARGGGGWHTVASARTGPRGGFDLHYTSGSTGRQRLRVQFAGDRQNGRSQAPAGQLTTYHTSVASWYDDGGSTACGFHAYFGVANRDLPCGTSVTFQYGGHSVTAVVDDRGPYVGGRDWDLNQNTAAALGFGGVDTVWSSI